MANGTTTHTTEERYRLVPFLSPLGVWSYGVGTAIGWGSFVVTSNQLLLEAGPLGSIIGMLIGTIIMVAVAFNYAFLMQRYPNSGGSYTYASHVLGKDRGFLTAWFLVLTHLAIFWANATSLPLFARYFMGSLFKVGYLYTIFGYEVYLGEVALTMAAISLTGLLCTSDKRMKERLMIVLALTFTCGIIVCFGASMLGFGSSGNTMLPSMIPDVSALSQVTQVAIMMPWAFIGFESISHSTEEFAFSRKKSLRLLLAIVATTTLLYVMVTLMSVSAYPSRYDNWLAYLSDLGNLSGLEALPPFYAANYYLGSTGVSLLMLSLLALVLTSLIGNTVALSRLAITLGHDHILPERFSELSDQGTPRYAILFLTAISLVIPLVGRTAIGWIVDITTIGAVIVYGLVSYAARRAAQTEGNRFHVAMGNAGLASMLVLGLIVFLPNLFSGGEIAQETYFLLTIWSILGFIYLRIIMTHDENDTYGQSVVVWIVMLSFVLFSSTVWLQKANISNAHATIDEIGAYYQAMGVGGDADTEAFVELCLAKLDRANLYSALISVGMFVVAMGMMMSNYAYVRSRHEKSKKELGAVRDIVYRDPLTGVKSKQAFVEQENEINARLAQGDTTPFAVVVCDVNGLKFINDTLGHQAGDEYIRAARHIVCFHFKHSPVFRIGGDEFAVVLQGTDFDERIEVLAAFDQEVESNIGTGEAVISAGLSTFDPSRDTTLHEVFERADARMYQRKMQLKAMGAATRD